MLHIIHRHDEEQAGDEDIEEGCDARLDRQWWECVENSYEESSSENLDQRILPRYFTLASLTLAFLKQKTENRHELMPLETLPAGETFRSPFEPHTGVVA